MEKDDQIIVREDFWTSTSNKQLNFVQHIYSLLKIDGRAAVVVPDNLLFERGAGKKVRRNLLQKCRVHTLLRLPTGIWYSPGVKANVLFFEKKEGRAKAWTDKLWVYDLRTNMHFTLKQSPIQRRDFDEFVQCYKPGKMHTRKETWSEENSEGRVNADQSCVGVAATQAVIWRSQARAASTHILPHIFDPEPITPGCAGLDSVALARLLGRHGEHRHRTGNGLMQLN